MEGKSEAEEEEKQMITCGKCGTEYEIDESTELNLCPNCEQLTQKTIEEE